MSMTTTRALHQTVLTQEIRNVSAALRELNNAARQLARALWKSLWQRHATPHPALTALQEANQLRAIADGIQASDPRLAQDLYAAANRHELASTPC